MTTEDNPTPMPSSPNAIEALIASPVRFSRLKRMGLSPSHYAEPWRPDTTGIRKGSALHSYMLGAKDKVAIYKGGARNAKFAKYKDFLAENQGKHILIPSEIVHVEGMRRAIEAHPLALDLLSDGVQEQTITWEYKGRKCIGTPDVVRVKPNGRKRQVELKSCDTSKPDWFMRKGRRLHYPAQVSWYNTGLDKSIHYQPGPVEEVFVVAVESTPPYPVTVLRVCDSMLKQGRDTWRPWFDTLLECERRRHFPAYAEGVVDWEDDEGDGLDWGDMGEAAE